MGRLRRGIITTLEFGKSLRAFLIRFFSILSKLSKDEDESKRMGIVTSSVLSLDT